jgi:hypothetical protein
MLGWILLAIGLGGFSVAAWLDLRTTEFPDWLPYCIIVLAVGVRAAFAWLQSDPAIVTTAILTGSLFLGFGLALYYTRQWGDGDAWLLGAMGFLFPDETGFVPAAGSGAPFPFPVTLLFNFFLISFIYLLVYSFGLGIRSRQASRRFFVELRKDARGMARVAVLFSAGAAALSLGLLWLGAAPYMLLPLALSPLVLLSVMFFMRYGRFIERDVFRRNVPVGRLREGDVLASDRWRGLTRKDIESLQRKGGTVEIKEGVRFAPVFVITLPVTLLVGNLLLVMA